MIKCGPSGPHIAELLHMSLGFPHMAELHMSMAFGKKSIQKHLVHASSPFKKPRNKQRSEYSLKRLPLRLQITPRPPISNPPASFRSQVSRIPNKIFSHVNGFSCFPDPRRKPLFGNLSSPLRLILMLQINSIYLLRLRDFRSLVVQKRNRRRGPIREMITRSNKLVEQLREYEIRSQHKRTALVIFSPKPQIITRYFSYLFGSFFPYD